MARAAQRTSSAPPALQLVDSAATPAASGWTIVDGAGAVVAEELRSRHLAVRLLGSFAHEAPLPLAVVDPSGQPTGDRLG